MPLWLTVDCSGTIMSAMERRLSPCGTPGAYQRHRKAGESCDVCKRGMADDMMRRRRAAGIPEWKPARHGTESGYIRHMKKRTKPCQPCIDAHREAQRQWRATRRRKAIRGSWPEVCLDYLETFGPASSLILTARIQDRHPEATEPTIRKSLVRLSERGLVENVDAVWDVTDDYLEGVA